MCEQCYKSISSDTRMRMRSNDTNVKNLCEYCKDKKRDAAIIMVVEKEIDMEHIEKTRKHNGLYHILGGTISQLEPSNPKKLHLKELFIRVKTITESRKNCEVILATNATADGDATALYIQRILEPIGATIKITRLGRGLTTGSELEYSDPQTIANALTNRR